MSTRAHSRLPAFALVAIVLSLLAAGMAVPAIGGIPFQPDVASAPDAVVAAAEDLTPSRDDPKRPTPIPAPSRGEQAASIALEAVGVPYRWGGASPESGFDCSGLVYWAYGRIGVVVPHSSYALYDEGRPVARARMKPGDVLFFSGLGHVGLYLGRGRMVHAPQTGRRVEVVKLAGSYYDGGLVGARRLLAD